MDFRLPRWAQPELDRGGSVNRGLGLLMVLVWAMVSLRPIHGRSSDAEEPARITVLGCDKVGLDAPAWLTAKEEAVRIGAGAGIVIVWVETGGGVGTATTFNADSFEHCEAPSSEFDFFVVISPNSPKGMPRNAMGFTPAPNSQHPRAYVFYDRVQNFMKNHMSSTTRKMDTGIILGHAIAHELGHLLMPDAAHSNSGIMSAEWAYKQVADAVAGKLLFQPAEARRIQEYVRSR
jgi:hypothetical protein